MTHEMHLFPGETPDKALARRVKMHEFLIPGGVQLGYNDDLKMQYSDAIDVDATPACPWHGEDCPAWDVIRSVGVTPRDEHAATIRDFRLVQAREIERVATGEGVERFKAKVSDSFQSFGSEDRKPSAVKTPSAEALEASLLVEDVDEIVIEGEEDGE